MKFVPQNPSREIEEHDKLIRQYLSEHQDEWRSLRGIRRLIARVRLEFRAWRYAARAFDKDGGYKLYLLPSFALQARLHGWRQGLRNNRVRRSVLHRMP